MAFPESKSIAWKVVEELLGITFSAAATGTPSSSTYLRGDGAWTDPSGALQPLDADLTAIAALGFVAAGLLKKTAANTWEIDTTAYAPVASPTFTGTPASVTAAATDDSTQIATTAHVKDYAPSGTYTPSLTNTTNIAASTAHLTHYIRVGNEVHVAGKVEIDVTAGTTESVLGMSLPIASDLTNEAQLAGVFVQRISGSSRESGTIKGDTTNDRATFEWYSSGIANYSFFFNFTYTVA